MTTQYEMTAETYRSASGILLHSRTVVEKRDFVSTGILTYAEGDILEIEMSEFKVFELGDTVKLTIYSPGGIYMFESTVVAKDNGALMVINPPQNQSRFAEKRECPRIQVKESGRLLSLLKADGSEQLFAGHVELSTSNISVSGLGFTLSENVGLHKLAIVHVHLNLGFEFNGKIEIVRFEKQAGGGMYYGARFIDMPKDKANSLRAFVLKKQVETHFSNKREAGKKRMFN